MRGLILSLDLFAAVITGFLGASILRDVLGLRPTLTIECALLFLAATSIIARNAARLLAARERRRRYAAGALQVDL